MGKFTENEMLLTLLADLKWHDVSEVDNRDQEAAQTFATGHRKRDGGNQLWMMNRYEDEGDDFALVTVIRGEVRKAPIDQDRLGWLWEKISGSVDDTA